MVARSQRQEPIQVIVLIHLIASCTLGVATLSPFTPLCTAKQNSRRMHSNHTNNQTEPRLDRTEPRLVHLRENRTPLRQDRNQTETDPSRLQATFGPNLEAFQTDQCLLEDRIMSA